MLYIQRSARVTLDTFLESKKVTMVLGARQVGKTTLVKHVLKGKQAQFLNLDLEIDKQRLLAAATITPEEAMKTLGSPSFLVIDEAQHIPQTGQIVKGWYDAGLSTKIILLGSSSLNLLDQSAESLTGRNEKLFLTPLILEEIISAQPWFSSLFPKDKLQKQFADQIQTTLLQSMVFGSYPEVVTSTDKRQLLTNLVSDYLLKDILQLGLVKTPTLIQKLLMLLAHQIGSLVSVNELANTLATTRVTIERYLDLLEKTFVIFRLSAFSTNQRKEIAKSTKIYFWDTGIRNALLNEFSTSSLRSDIGKLWENWVVAEFAKQNRQSIHQKNLYFWRSRAGSEVDLVIKDGESIAAYEIKWSYKKVAHRAFQERYGVKVQIIDKSKSFVTV